MLFLEKYYPVIGGLIASVSIIFVQGNVRTEFALIHFMLNLFVAASFCFAAKNQEELIMSKTNAINDLRRINCFQLLDSYIKSAMYLSFGLLVFVGSSALVLAYLQLSNKPFGVMVNFLMYVWIFLFVTTFLSLIRIIRLGQKL